MSEQTTWTKPGGDCRKLELGNLIIRWYVKNQSVTIEGKDEDKIKDCLRNLARKETDHDDIINSSTASCDLQKDRTFNQNIIRDCLDNSVQTQYINDLPDKPEDVAIIWDKVEKMEERFELKMNELSDEVCK